MTEFGKYPQFSQLHKPDLAAKEVDKIKSMYKEIEIPYELCMQKDLILESPIHKRIFEFVQNSQGIRIMTRGNYLMIYSDPITQQVHVYLFLSAYSSHLKGIYFRVKR